MSPVQSRGVRNAFFQRPEYNVLLRSGESPLYILATIEASIIAEDALEVKALMEEDLFHSTVTLSTVSQQNKKIPIEVIDELMSNRRIYKIILQTYPGLLKQRHFDEVIKTWHGRCWQAMNQTFDFRIFTEFHFLMFNISAVVLSAWFIVPYFYLNSYMNSLNIEGGPTMIDVIGISSSIGIVILGWAGDQPWINVTKAYTVCLLLCGLSVGAYPFFITNFWVVAVLSSVFGFTFASSYSYTPAILMELMPMDHFTVSYGMNLLSQGIGQVVGPPLAGMIFDITGAWDLTFYIAGIWLVISGICLGAVCYTKDFRLCGTAPLLKDTEVANKTSDSV